MPRVKTKAALLTATPGPDPTWSPAVNPAMAELLDHLAKELAGEYVRLMERAAERSALVLRRFLGPIRLEPTRGDIGRPYYLARTSIDALALLDTLPDTLSEGDGL